MNNLQKIPSFSVCRLSKLAIVGLLLSTASFTNGADLMKEASHLNSDPIKEVADSISKDVELE